MATTNFFYHMYLHVDIKKILNKNKNIFEKMSGYVGFLPPPTYFLHTLLGLLHADHSVYVGSTWVGVRILHIHSFFRKCFYSCSILIGPQTLHSWLDIIRITLRHLLHLVLLYVSIKCGISPFCVGSIELANTLWQFFAKEIRHCMVLSMCHML